MSGDTPASRTVHFGGESDPFADARGKLFGPLRNRVLAQASDALAAHRVDMAESLVSGVLGKKPKDPDALNLMADIARRSHRFEEAEQLLARSLAAAPDRAGYRFNHAVILRRLEKFDGALAQLDVLLASDAKNPLYREQKAAVLRQMGRLAEALVLRRDLAREFPENPEVWLQFGHALRSVGAGPECVDAYRKVIELSPASSTAYTHLADLKTYRFTATETAAMEVQLLRQGLAADQRASLHFALGKAWGDVKQYAKSFDNFAKGNALRRAGVEFDPERLTAHRRNCEAAFTQQFFCDRAGWGCPSNAPIFLVGLPRSGSTLIEQILSSHSAIEGLGELADLDNVVSRKLSTEEGGRPAHEFWISGWLEFRDGLIQAFPRAMDHFDAQDFLSLGEEYLRIAGGRCTLERPYFTDKGLRNFGYVGLIHLALPNARIIDVRRHPLDCGWSLFKSHFPGGQPFSERLGDIGRHYTNYVRLMAHFDEVLPGRVHRVIYEELIADPEREVRRLLEYVGLKFEEQCLRFHENKRAVGTLSSEQVRAPLYRTGVAQWQPYEPWLGPLKSTLGDVLERYPGYPD